MAQYKLSELKAYSEIKIGDSIMIDRHVIDVPFQLKIREIQKRLKCNVLFITSIHSYGVIAFEKPSHEENGIKLEDVYFDETKHFYPLEYKSGAWRAILKELPKFKREQYKNSFQSSFLSKEDREKLGFKFID